MNTYRTNAYDVQGTATGETIQDAVEAFLLEITPAALTIEEAAVIAGWGEDEIDEWVADVIKTCTVCKVSP
jgi:hypothetical protein